MKSLKMMVVVLAVILVSLPLLALAQDYQELDIELARNFAKLQCPDLSHFSNSQQGIESIFDQKGKVQLQWLQTAQLSVLVFSRGDVTLEIEKSPMFLMEGTFVNLVAENKKTHKTRKYLIIKGYDQIACEIVEERREIPKKYFLNKK